MEVHQKRQLLEAIDILIRRPAQANEKTLAEAMGCFKLLVEELTNDEILVTYVDVAAQNLPF